MNVKERVLASRLVEKSKQNQKLAEQIGLTCKLSRMKAGGSQKPKSNKIGVLTSSQYSVDNA